LDSSLGVLLYNKTILLLSFFAIFATASAANVTLSSPYPASNLTRSATLNAFFATYIPNSIVANSLYYNATIGTGHYLLVRANQSLYSFFIINTTNKANYTFVFNITLPYEVLQPYLLNKYYPAPSVISNLTTQMQLYISQAKHPLADCLIVTGLDNKMCTAGEPIIQCLQTSCQSVPICNDGIQAFPPPSPFTQAIENFSVQYQLLNFSEQNYLTLAAGLSPSTISVYLRQMSNLLSTISATAAQIPLSPLFPPPRNMTNTQIAAICNPYLSSSTMFNSGPWYCYDVGLCDYA
jgi:hypothetical protein